MDMTLERTLFTPLQTWIAQRSLGAHQARPSHLIRRKRSPGGRDGLRGGLARSEEVAGPVQALCVVLPENRTGW